jgi:hypothetical protein
MKRFNRLELQEIQEMMENGLNLISNLDRVKKMKMRSQIRNQIEIIAEWDNPSMDRIMVRFEDKLYEVFNQYPYGFLEDFKKMLSIKTARFRSFRTTRFGHA